MPNGSRFGFLNNMHAAYQSTYINMKWHVEQFCGNRHMEWPTKEDNKYSATYRLRLRAGTLLVVRRLACLKDSGSYTGGG